MHRARPGAAPGDVRDASVRWMPRHWFWTQVAIVVCVLVGMIIAITKLA